MKIPITVTVTLTTLALATKSDMTHTVRVVSPKVRPGTISTDIVADVCGLVSVFTVLFVSVHDP